MLKGFRTMIYPTQEQAEKIIKFCNAARYAYNWAIDTEENLYRTENKFLSGYQLNNLFNKFKRQEGNEWMREISGRAMKVAILNAAISYERFFKGLSKRPKYKTKKRSKMSCATHEGTTLIEKKKIRCEKLGWIKCHKHNIPMGEDIIYYNPKLSFDGDNYWFSVSVECKKVINDKSKTEPIGIDLGVKTLATCSNGMIFQKPNINREKKRLNKMKRRADRIYQTMIKNSDHTTTKFDQLLKSKNLLKLESKIRKQYRHITNILENNIHNITKQLVLLNPEAIVIEDLYIEGMRKNRGIAEKINEAKFYDFRKKLTYKCDWYEIKLIVADRWYASSKICSCCGHKKEKLSLNERIYICDECGTVIDRDFNAALNLKYLAM